MIKKDCGRRIYGGRCTSPFANFLISDLVLQDTKKIFCKCYQNYLRHLWLKFFIFRLVEGGFLKELFIKHYENLMNHHKRISICLFFKILQLNRKNYVNNWSKTNKNFPISGLLASFPEQMNIMCLVFFMYFAINWSYAASKIIFSKNMQPLSKYFRKHLKTAIFFLSAENDDVINP